MFADQMKPMDSGIGAILALVVLCSGFSYRSQSSTLLRSEMMATYLAMA
jgi:hypothetical protein